ncbi:hypothetical protein CQ022_03495 [Chryseobacterium culicis]|uniref:Uncharacterized protein n=1 Tax=Chryseobacterium culicis TaxID=680127 RepID=A0A2S9CXY7_CHRCI|nr:hypothetical protein CQ022_03495 [Chryseobacterium culicis]PRB90946.1 hypothetical protein CQ033_09495 [Chryseobacterium culicis]
MMKQNCSIKRKKTSTYVEAFISLFHSDFEFILMKSESWGAKLLKFNNKIPRGLLFFIKKLSKLYQPQKSPELLF